MLTFDNHNFNYSHCKWFHGYLIISIISITTITDYLPSQLTWAKKWTYLHPTISSLTPKCRQMITHLLLNKKECIKVTCSPIQNFIRHVWLWVEYVSFHLLDTLRRKSAKNNKDWKSYLFFEINDIL